jgi:hypothetical protein
MEKSFFGIPQGSFLGLLLLLIYIGDLPLSLERYFLPVLIAEETSVLIIVTNITNFLSNSREIFPQLNKWLSANLSLLNDDKTNFSQFRTKNSLILDTKLEYNNNSLHTKLDTKFLGIIMDSTLQWKAHKDSHLMKINAARNTLGTLKLIMSEQCYCFFLFLLDYVLQHK